MRTNLQCFLLSLAATGLACGDSSGTGGAGTDATTTTVASNGTTARASSASTGTMGGPCQIDNDCDDDGVYCNGTPTCIEGTCTSTPVDCGATPAGCASITCDETAMACVPEPFDDDGDGHGDVGCDGGTIPDDDCDDGDAQMYPGNWDGPMGDGNPDACDDGIDQDCSGTPDDGTLADGTTCTCEPGETRACGTDVGACEFGTETCSAQGQWGGCIGGTTPIAETCNGVDDDCNGSADDGNPGAGMSCATGVPGPCSTGVTVCQNGGVSCMQTVFGTAEVCNGADEDCDGVADNGFNLSSACDGPDGDACATGIVVCDGAGGATCNDPGGDTTFDNCDAGNDGDCNGVPNQGCGCINGQTQGCGDPTCGSGVQSCGGGAWQGCTGDPQPGSLSQNGDGSGNSWDDFAFTCSGSPGGTNLGTFYYSGPISPVSPSSVGGTMHMETVSGGCWVDNNTAFTVSCYAALPGCNEPPEGWGAAHLGAVNIPQQPNNQYPIPSTSVPGRTVCCDVLRSSQAWTPAFNPCCHRRMVFDWQANGCI